MSTFLELPSVFIDSAAFQDLGSSYFSIINRNPEPNETGVSRDLDIRFNLVTDSGDAPVASGLTVYMSIDGSAEVTVYDGSGSVFQGGYNGPNSAVTLPDPNTLLFVLDPTFNFTSLQEVTLRIAATSTGAQTLNTSWTFTVEDVSTPQVSSADPQNKLIVRVTFDEAVLMSSDSNGALNASNYSFARTTVPAVNVVASSVAQVSSSSVDVSLDIEMTPGAGYTVTVSSVEDLVGNVVVPPTNVVSFLGYQPGIPTGRNFNLYKMLPQKNRDEDSGDLEKFMGCLQEILNLLLCEVDSWTDIIDPDICEEQYLDAMLDDLGNPFDFDLTVNEKRKLVQALSLIYKQKGTAQGIINVVNFFLGISVTITTSFDSSWVLGVDRLGEGTTLGPGTSYALYSFSVVSPVTLTSDQRDQIRTIATYMKGPHEHLIEIAEPTTPVVFDHLVLGVSQLGLNWTLH